MNVGRFTSLFVSFCLLAPALIVAESLPRPAFLADYKTYMRYAGGTVQFNWKPSTEAAPEGKNNAADYYQVDVYHYERDLMIPTSQTTQTQVSYVLPFAGHFRFSVRACNKAGCSDYCESTSATCGLVDGKPAAFWVYAMTPPPGKPSISIPIGLKAK